MNNISQTKGKVAAVIEITGSHEECIYAQLLHLKRGGYHTLLICSANLERKVFEFDQADEFFYFDVQEERRRTYLKLLRIRSLLVERNVSVVCINSAHGKLIQNLVLLPYPKGMKFFGVLHGLNKLRKSITQKLISRNVKNYFLLNDYLIENLKKISVKNLRFTSYYPIFFPSFTGQKKPEKPEGQLWITVPGQVEFARRDYISLVEAFAKLPVKPDIKFIFLGSWDHKDGNGPELKERIQALGIASYFEFTGYLQNAPFHSILQASDAVMTLIHPINKDMEKYLEDQISGSYNLAFAYKTPLLMHAFFNRYEDFQDTAFFYELDNLEDFLAGLSQTLKSHRPLYQHPKWTLEAQTKNYLDFIENV